MGDMSCAVGCAVTACHLKVDVSFKKTIRVAELHLKQLILSSSEKQCPD